MSPSRIRVIGFAGPIGAGKTTAAQHLVETHGYVRHRLAGPLKDMMRALGLSNAELDGDRKEEPSPLLCGRTPRWAMQTLGTEWGRNLIDPEIWVTIWMARAQAALDAGAVGVVADDVRFPNEVEAIHRLGGVVVRVSRRGVVTTGHSSEMQELEVELDIVNDRTTKDLGVRVDHLTKVEGLRSPMVEKREGKPTFG